MTPQSFSVMKTIARSPQKPIPPDVDDFDISDINSLNLVQNFC
jgi:hypothetical protein